MDSNQIYIQTFTIKRSMNWESLKHLSRIRTTTYFCAYICGTNIIYTIEKNTETIFSNWQPWVLIVPLTVPAVDQSPFFFLDKKTSLERQKKTSILYLISSMISPVSWPSSSSNDHNFSLSLSAMAPKCKEKNVQKKHI